MVVLVIVWSGSSDCGCCSGCWTLCNITGGEVIGSELEFDEDDVEVGKVELEEVGR